MNAKILVLSLLSFTLLTSQYLVGQKVVVPFEKKHGVFEVNVKVYELARKFIFDTGASSISFGESFFNDLTSKGYINQSNILGTTQCIIADGSCLDATIVKLDYVSLGEFEMRDVQATVIKANNVPFLLGQSLLSKFGQITLDYNNSQLIIDQSTVNKYKNTCEELRFIPCNVNSISSCEKLINDIKSDPKWTFKKLTKETNVPPPTNALKNISNPVTIRYFDNDDFNMALKLKTELLNKGYSIIKIQNMLPFYGYKPISGYFEIWIK